MTNLKKEVTDMLNKSVRTEIKPVQFRNKRTGAIATQIPILDMGNWERVGNKPTKPKKPNPATAKFSEMIQYQLDLQKWRRFQ